MTCLHERLHEYPKELDDSALLRVVHNHKNDPSFRDPASWKTDFPSWQQICVYKSAVRQEARRRGLL